MLAHLSYRPSPETGPTLVVHPWRSGRTTTLADLEKTFLVMTDADSAFDLLSDPVRLPDYVPTLRLDDSTAVEGELDVDADLAERGGAPDAGFTADRATRRIDWGRPTPDYGGSITVAAGTANTSSVTLRLHTPDDRDPVEVTRVVEQAISNMRRLLSRRGTS
jgi:hypothetical protein